VTGFRPRGRGGRGGAAKARYPARAGRSAAGWADESRPCVSMKCARDRTRPAPSPKPGMGSPYAAAISVINPLDGTIKSGCATTPILVDDACCALAESELWTSNSRAVEVSRSRPFGSGQPQVSGGGPFTLCSNGYRARCVVDGDTIHYAGLKIRLEDIDAPETYQYKCESEPWAQSSSPRGWRGAGTEHGAAGADKAAGTSCNKNKKGTFPRPSRAVRPEMERNVSTRVQRQNKDVTR